MFLIYQKGYNIVFIVGTFFLFLKKANMYKGKKTRKMQKQFDCLSVVGSQYFFLSCAFFSSSF